MSPLVILYPYCAAPDPRPGPPREAEIIRLRIAAAARRQRRRRRLRLLRLLLGRRSPRVRRHGPVAPLKLNPESG